MAEKRSRITERIGGYVSRRTMLGNLGQSKVFLKSARRGLPDRESLNAKTLSYLWHGPSQEDGRKIFARSAGNVSDAEKDAAISNVNRAMILFMGLFSVIILAWFFGYFPGVLGAFVALITSAMAVFILVIMTHQKNQIREERIMGIKETIFGK